MLSTVRRVEAGQGRSSPTGLVWYASYGSNMHTERLRCYLEGGRPPGGSRTYPGARDPRMPVRSAPVELPGTVYFATESPVWTGGRAFYDPTAPGTAWARAHLVTAGQFADIAAQEMYAVPGEDRALDLGLGLDAALATGTARLGPGRYETLVCPGSLDTVPVLTFTAPWRAADVPWTRPSAPYLRLLASGLLQTGAWPPAAITAYLAARPGAAGHWTPAEIGRLVGGEAGA